MILKGNAIMYRSGEIDFSTLSIIGRQLSMEGMSQESFIGDFSKYVGNIFNAFRNTSNLLEVRGFSKAPEQNPLSKESKQFLKLVDGIPYSNMMVLQATVPEGLNCTYLEILEPLLQSSQYLKGIQAHVVQPFSLYLASFLSNENTSLSSESKRYEYTKLEQERDQRIASFTKLYKADSYNTTTTVKNVVNRNADWSPILSMQKEVISNLEAVDRKTIKREIDTCVDYLALIADNLKRNNVKTRPEAAERLSMGAYQVAKELEYFSNTYYRALGLSNAIESTIGNIRKVYG